MTIQVERASFSERIRYLQEEDGRLSWPGSVNLLFVQNMTSTLIHFNVDLSNVLKEATLLQPSSNATNAENSDEQTVVAIEKKYSYKNLGYYCLFEVLMSLLNKISKIPNRHDEVAKSLLDTLCYTLVFVDENTRIDVPAQVAGMLYQIEDASSEMQECFMNAFCKTIIPVSFGIVSDKSLRDLDDIPNIIMLILECVRDVALHFRLIETLMLFKENLWIDVLSVISFSDGIARVYATQLLFHYWPHLHCTTTKRHQLPSSLVYNPTYCENTRCQSPFSMRTATTMVLDASYPAKIAESPAPLYLCNSCTQTSLENEKRLDYVDVVLPTESVTYCCENKHCLSKESIATVTLLGSKSSFTGGGGKYVSQAEKHQHCWHFHNRIMRYCLECYHNLQHVIGNLNLTAQIAPISAWDQTQPQYTRVIVDAVVCLLTEDVDLSAIADTNASVCTHNKIGVYPCDGCMENVGMQALPKTLTHFGIWLLVSLCPPQVGIDEELASQLIAAVLVWYKNKSRVSFDDHGSLLQNMKSSLLWQWLKDMQGYYFKIFLNCLLPNPPSEARVKGNWDSIHSLLYYYNTGLNFLSILAPYSIISFELWECLMPCWMTALCENLNVDDLKKLEPTLSLLFDKQLSPLGFESHDVFNFILRNFEETELIHHENALEWIQLLCEVHVAIPIPKLIEMLLISASSMQLYLSTTHNQASDSDGDNEEHYCHYRLPGLTEHETWRIMNRSRYPGVDSLTDILDAMYTSTSDMCEDASHDKLHSCSNKRSIIRSGSMRASKRIKAAFLKPKRSLTRRHQSRGNEEVSEHERPLSPRMIRTPPTPNIPMGKVDTPAGRKLDREWKYARIVCCYVDVLDVVLQQLQLQEHEQHTGLTTTQSISAINLLCNIFWNILENNEEKTQAKDTMSEYMKAELEFTADFCNLAAKLLGFMVPTEVTKKQKRSYDLNDWTYFVEPVNLSMELDLSEEQDSQTSNHSVRLLYFLVKILELYEKNRAITNHVIKCIYLLCINGNMFDETEMEKIRKELDYRTVISNLWRQLDVHHSNTSRMAVAVLFQVLDSIENAWSYQFQLFNAPFCNGHLYSSRDKSIESWNKEHEALDRIHALLMFLCDHEMEHLQKRTPVSHVAAYALAVLLSTFGSKHSAVYIKAKFIIDSLSAENLQMAYQCLQYEFDSSLKDRTFILSQYLTLHQLRPDSSPLSFACFSRMMDVLSNEVKLCQELAPIMQFVQIVGSDLSRASKSSNFRTSNSITFEEWLRMADLKVEVDNDFCGKNHKTQKSSQKPILQEFNFDKVGVAESKTRTEKNDYLDDKYTVDFLMRAMCRYMIDCKKDAEEQLHLRSHNFFQYFRNWIGFHERIGLITKSGDVLRNSVGVNTLLKNLPNIMDANLILGKFLLPKVVSFLTVIVKMADNTSSQPPKVGTLGYDLGVLCTTDQIAWLKTLQVIMYKYTISDDVEVEQFSNLLNICLNVLLFEFHSCGTNGLEMDSSCCERSKKSDKFPGSTSTKRRALEKIGKHIVFNVGPSTFTESGAHENDEASKPLLMNSSNRQDPTLDLFDDTTMTKDASVNTGGRSDMCKLAELIPRIRSMKNGKFLDSTSSTDSLLSVDNCKRCKTPLKEYNVETISLSIANLCQFVRFNSTSAVKFLPQLLSQLALIAEPMCEEQCIEALHFSNTPADVVLVAKQSIRCILHQLADSRIFSSIFYISFPRESSFLRVLIGCLRGYHLFHCMEVLKHTLEDLPGDLKLPGERLFALLSNMSTYLQYLHNESAYNINWQPLANLFATFFNNIQTQISRESVTIGMDILLMLMINLLKAPILIGTKYLLLEPFSKIVSTSISKYSFSSELLYELCEVNYDHDLFVKDKDRLHLTRCVVTKLVSVLKMHLYVPVRNLLHLLQIVLLDAGSRVNSMSVSEQLSATIVVENHCYAMEGMKSHVGDCLEVLGDSKFLHNLNNTNSSKLGQSATGLNPIEEAYQMNLKLAISQIVAGQLHLYHSTSHQFQSLFQPPSTIQHGQKEQSECLSQIKKLSWILLGTLSHLGLQQGSSDNLWYPIPFNKGPDLANIVQVILTGCLDQTKETNLNLTSLFYAFLFCQLWTVYCEQFSYFTTFGAQINFSSYNPVGDHKGAGKLLFEFWNRLTPCILLLLQDGKDPQVLASVHRHIESLMDCLQEYNSSILNKLAPLWLPMLNDNLIEQKSNLVNHEFVLRDPPSPFISSHYIENEHSDTLDCGASGLALNGAKVNAERVLTIVERVNRNLIYSEKNDLCVL